MLPDAYPSHIHNYFSVPERSKTGGGPIHRVIDPANKGKLHFCKARKKTIWHRRICALGVHGRICALGVHAGGSCPTERERERERKQKFFHKFPRNLVWLELSIKKLLLVVLR